MRGRARAVIGALVQTGFAVYALAALAAPNEPPRWTPHSAAALLDATFPSAEACQSALDAARRHERAAPSKPIHGLSYAQLFDQGACRSFHHKAVLSWRIRMHWSRSDGRSD